MSVVTDITERAEYALNELGIGHEYREVYHFDTRIPQKSSSNISADFRIGRYHFIVSDETLMLEEEKNTRIDNKILESLSNDLSMMIRIINQKGTTTFQETEKVKEVREKLIALIADMQFYKILSSELHISNSRTLE